MPQLTETCPFCGDDSPLLRCTACLQDVCYYCENNTLCPRCYDEEFWSDSCWSDDIEEYVDDED